MVTSRGTGSQSARKKSAAKLLKADRVQPANGNGASSSNHDVLRRMYVSMQRCRMLTERAQHLSSGSTPTTDWEFSIGHEAILVGSTLELGVEDTFVASPNNLPAQIAKGARLEIVVSQAEPANQIPAVVANGHSTPKMVAADPFNLGTGVALAHRLEKRRNVVVALGTDDPCAGDRWHEALKFAGIHKLPIIYVLKRRSAFALDPAHRNPVLDDLSFVARDCGFPAIIVDGKDAVAVWRVTQESIHRARNGAGPTLIECEIQQAGSGDPLAHMEHYMKKRGAWDGEWRRESADRIEDEIAGAVSAAK